MQVYLFLEVSIMAKLNLTRQEIQQYIAVNELSLGRRQNTAEADCIFRHGGFVGSSIESHSALPRAMEHARQSIKKANAENRSFANGTIFLAETLSGSKGRFTRTWHAPIGGLWGCLVHVGSLMDDGRKFLPMAVGLSCCQAMHDFGAANASVRWVNDVLCDSKKLAGFLVESYTDPTYGERYDLIGFGINLNNTKFPAELQQIAGSLSQVVGKRIDIHEFACAFFAKLTWNIGLLYFEEEYYLQNEKYSGSNNEQSLLVDWKEHTDTIGQRVRYGFDVEEKPQYEATVLEVLGDGGLLMQFDDGTTITEYSGEVRYLTDL